MQSLPSAGRAVLRIAFRRGSPQRLQYSRRLVATALAALLVLATAVQVLVFGADLVDVCLYLFTVLAALYLGTALLSRRAPATRLRPGLQATLVLLAAGHALVLLTAPLAPELPWLPWSVAVLAAAAVVAGTTSCVQFALGSRRSKAAVLTVAFACVAVGFQATMHWLLGIAMA